MPKLKIADVSPRIDGEYEFDLTGFNGHEAHLIKQIAGVRLGELNEALNAGDYDLVVAFAKILVERAGESVPVDVLLNAPLGKITVDLRAGAKQEDEDRPPASSPTPSGVEKEPVGPSSESLSTKPSGPSSDGDGDLRASDPPPTGDPPSASTSTSAPLTSAS
jgi:hypothetical protein